MICLHGRFFFFFNAIQTRDHNLDFLQKMQANSMANKWERTTTWARPSSAVYYRRKGATAAVSGVRPNATRTSSIKTGRPTVNGAGLSSRTRFRSAATTSCGGDAGGKI